MCFKDVIVRGQETQLTPPFSVRVTTEKRLCIRIVFTFAPKPGLKECEICAGVRAVASHAVFAGVCVSLCVRVCV